MDVLAHGLWGGALFGRRTRWQWRFAFLLGTAPDVLAFGPFFISLFVSQGFNPGWRQFPSYVYSFYDITHSLVVWSAVTAVLWLWRRSFPWIFLAWGLHVVCDIPLHEISFFPTPYLWPFSTPLVDGFRWAQPAVMIPNYLALFVAYSIWFGLRYRKRRQDARQIAAQPAGNPETR